MKIHQTMSSRARAFCSATKISLLSHTHTLLITSGFTFFATHSVKAEIILDEPFNYTIGAINRDPLPSAPGLIGGGFGFTGPWIGGGTVVNPGQSNPTITSSGFGFSSADQNAAFRFFRSAINVNPTTPTTVFVRYITSATSATPPQFAGFSFFSGPNPGNTEELFLGKPWMATNYGFEITDSGGPQASSIPVNQAETLLVFRISFTSGADVVDMFVNPGATLPDTPDFTRTAPVGVFQNFTHIRLASGNNGQSFDVDQVRVSNTYAEAISTVNLDADSDLDGLPDAWEALYPNPNGLTVGINDAGSDPDGDTLTNATEFARSTNPKLQDTDSDGLRDDYETNTGNYISSTNSGTNPIVADTDNDELIDGVENNTLVFVIPGNTGTNPFDQDSDDDGMPDGLEVTRNTNPTLLASVSPPGDLATIGRDNFNAYPNDVVANLKGGIGFDYDILTSNGPFIGHTTRVAAWEDRLGTGAEIVAGKLITNGNAAIRAFHGIDSFFGNEGAGRIAKNSTAQVVYLRADLTRDESSLISLLGASSDGFVNFSAGILQNTNSEYVFGISGVTIGAVTVPPSYTPIQATDGQEYVVVLKVDYSTDTLSLWIDPNLAAAEATPSLTTPIPAGQLGSFISGIRLSSTGTSTWDNVVVSREWAALSGGGAPVNTYATWIAGFPAVGALSGFNDDADRDGLTNGVENFLGGNPSQFTQGLVQAASVGNQLTFRHRKNNTPATNVSTIYEWTTDLVNWFASGQTNAQSVSAVITSAIITDQAAPLNDIIEITVAPSSPKPIKFFTRVKATLAP